MEHSLNQQNYQDMLDKLLGTIATEICGPCTEPHKNQHALNLEAPLSCGCRCPKIQSTLNIAAQWQQDLSDLPPPQKN